MEIERLTERLVTMKAQRVLRSIHVTPHAAGNTTPEQMAGKLNQLLDAVEAGNSRMLFFNDSQLWPSHREPTFCRD